MIGPVCPRCGVRATGLKSSIYVWQVLPCGEWLNRQQARVVAEASEKAEPQS